MKLTELIASNNAFEKEGLAEINKVVVAHKPEKVDLENNITKKKKVIDIQPIFGDMSPEKKPAND